ncbi:MAG TPA: hypothetical protein PLH43_13650 [Acetivibrio sp.]|uniref:hypothetical protein n=1 Tax=Acetivibrio sp. TaxID=1872092 RepID=UPI002D09AD59|nr:hypothetical protein [Acetivibrio sp.]HOM03842.1 hypothetical protein [Acetivibrio sp.]
MVKHQDQRPNNTLLILCGTAGIRIKWFDDRVKIIEVEKVEFRNRFCQLNHPFPIGLVEKQKV